jgi:hypothetical protein
MYFFGIQPLNVLTQNKSGFKAVLTSTGASIQKLFVPSCRGQHRLVNVVLG